MAVSETNDENWLAMKSAPGIVAGVYIGLSPIAADRIAKGMSAGEYLEVLVRSQLYLDAIKFIAYSLPIRYAVWWAYLCVELGMKGKLEPTDEESLAAVRAWVIDPSDENRHQSERAGQLGGLNSPTTILARSSSYVGVELPQPKYSKPRNFPAKGVWSAVWIAAAKLGDQMTAFQQFLVLGLDISRGKRLWDE